MCRTRVLDHARSASKRVLEGSSLDEHTAQRESKCACAQQSPRTDSAPRSPFAFASVDLTLDSDEDDAQGASSAVTAGVVHVAAPSESAIQQVCVETRTNQFILHEAHPTARVLDAPRANMLRLSTVLRCP